MFAEDTGEATLFCANGETIHRKIAEPRDSNEVVRERRPDILVPDDLLYNLSLLGKLMKPAEPEIQKLIAPAAVPTEQSKPGFGLDNLMGSSQGFWGWFKNVLKLQ
jgi:hypothetical protein